jgi:hypothetical protein
MVLQIFWVIFLMFIWFKTDAFVQYVKLFKLSKITKVDLWESYRLSSPKITYLEYISVKHNNFFTKLLSCKPCFTFWIVLIISIIFNSPISEFAMIYILSYIIYKLCDKYVW